MSGRQRARQSAWLALADARLLWHNGPGGPRYGERIFIDPRRCTQAAPALDDNRTRSGEVEAGRWEVAPLESVAKVAMAERHWRTGESWDEVGAVDHVVDRLDRLARVDGVRSIADVRARFARLDEVFRTVERDRRLRTSAELGGHRRRELGGVYVHIAGDGSPVFGNGGCHRLAMARVLELTEIPAQLGVLHADARRTWRALRSPGDG